MCIVFVKKPSILLYRLSDSHVTGWDFHFFWCWKLHAIKMIGQMNAKQVSGIRETISSHLHPCYPCDHGMAWDLVTTYCDNGSGRTDRCFGRWFCGLSAQGQAFLPFDAAIHE